MKRLFTILLVLISTFTLAQTSLTVTVTNIRDVKGTIRVGLYNSEKDFLKTIYQGKLVKASKPEITVLFENLPAGEYAISVIHDENENEILDTNKLGIPNEGFCFGNNALGKFGPAAYQKVKIKLENTPVTQVLTMKYFYKN